MHTIAAEIDVNEPETAKDLAEGLELVKTKVSPADILMACNKSGKGHHTVKMYMSGKVEEIRNIPFAVRLLNFLNGCAAVNQDAEDRKLKIEF